MSIEVKESYVLVAGFAQLPKGTPVFELQKTIGCILMVDTETDTIIKATFTFLQELTNEFVSELLRGKSLFNTDEIIVDIEKRFIVPPQKAVIQALLTAKKSYQERKNNFEIKENACK
ncbi:MULTISPECIES: DUF3870 domain-containing protein [unclassified Peribacillus]|uniref:DUF3870 domain-containing protein n=1 Tax=unclassified Peribacillus TaxID=2675266 RepID=UPI001911BB22|nr:DUF3870 domain-containing protein [Peribacillus sp. TH14]MBK5502211.1 DUF3870 domain-containing protein [Peribacillus sp. TH14]